MGVPSNLDKWVACILFFAASVSSMPIIAADTIVMQLERKAENGDAEAQAQLGLDLLYGVTRYQDDSQPGRDIKRAEILLLRAAKQNHWGAALTLGNLYFEGAVEGQSIVKRNYFASSILLMAGIEGLNKEISRLPDGSEKQNYKETVGLLEFKLGETYYHGCEGAANFSMLVTCPSEAEGVLVVPVEDFPKARLWFERAATNGSSPAAFELGEIYENGFGVPQDYTAARNWYLKAGAIDPEKQKKFPAEGGAYINPIRKQAFSAIGRIYVNLADFVNAHMWFNLAQDRDNRDGVAKLMAPAEVLRAQQMATAWLEREQK